MTIINPKSIAGVTSITTASGADNLLTVHTNNGTERFRIDNTGTTKIVTGIVTTLTVTTGIVTTLTTNTLTANSTTKVGSGITVSPDGDIFATGVTTATTFSGSGASLTNLNASNIASGTVPTARLGSGTASSSTFLRGDSTFAAVTSTTINSNADNRIITGSGTANTLNGEDELTYSTYLNLTRANTDTNFGDNSAPGGTQGIFVSNSQSTNGVFSALTLAAKDTNGTDQSASFIAKSVSGGYVPEVHITSRTASNTNESNFKITSSREVEVRYQGSTKLKTTNTGVDITGNVAFASGNGIDFSATSGSGTSELFDDYEEGTFTPEFNSGSAASACYAAGVSYSSQVGVYRKVGHVVHFIVKIQVSSGTTKSGLLQINNLPFTSGDFSTYSIVGGAFLSYTSGYFSDTANIPTIFIQPGGTALQFYNTAGNNFAGSHLAQATGRLDINGFYFTS